MKWPMTPLGAVGLVSVIAINAWLATAIVAELGSDPMTGPGKADWNVSLSAAPATPHPRKPLDAYPEILAHPVFFKSRAPFVPPPPAPPAPVMVAPPPPSFADPGLVLGGVMINQDVKKAYVFSKASASGAWTREGDEFMGWQVRTISGTAAKLEQRGRSIDLQLYPRD
jgi:hypothetical protein